MGDHSVLEVFGQYGRARISSRVYPTSSTNQAGMFVRSHDLRNGMGNSWHPALREVWQQASSSQSFGTTKVRTFATQQQANQKQRLLVNKVCDFIGTSRLSLLNIKAVSLQVDAYELASAWDP